MRSVSMRRSVRALAAAAVAAVGVSRQAHGATFNISWDGGATGNYNTATNWSTNTVPNNNDITLDFFNVTINRPAGTNVTANIVQTEVLNLTIGANAGNQLTLNDNVTFGVIGTTSNGPATINNAGTIQLGTTGSSAAQFNFLGSTTNITGGGTIVMLGGATLFGSGTVTSDNTIRGQGSIGENNFAFINNGTVIANSTLLIDPRSSGGFDNNGLIQCTGGGTLQLSGNGGGSFTNTGGTINANGLNAINPAIIELINGVTITGGTMSTNASGRFALNSGETATLSNVTMFGRLNQSNGATLTLTGTITNNGTIAMVGSSAFDRGTILLGASTVTFNGTGTYQLGNSTGVFGNVGGTGTLVNNSTITGWGAIGNSAETIRNNGTISTSVGSQSTVAGNVGVATGVFNAGSILAANGDIVIGIGTVDNTGGLIKAMDSNRISFANTTTGSVNVSGGTIASVANSTLILNSGGGTLNLTNVFVDNAGFLTLSSNNTLSMQASTLQNSGGVLLSPGAGTVSAMNFNGGTTTLTGGGSISFSGAATGSASMGGTGTVNNLNNLIHGRGVIGDGNLTIFNSGTISADVSTELFDINLGPDNLTNTGTLLSAGAFLRLINVGGGVVNNAGGTITTVAGGVVKLSGGIVVTGGTLKTDSLGVIQVGSSTATLASLTNIGRISCANGTLTLAGTITNSGSFQISQDLNAATLAMNGTNVTLNGAGEVRLNLDGGFGPANIGGTGTLTNASNLIHGHGNIGNNTLAVTNAATISADQSTAVLTLNPGSGGVRNTGTLQAIGGGFLTLADGTFDNTGGTISASASSIVRLTASVGTSVNITGGTLTTLVNGSIQLIDGSNASLTNVTNTGSISLGDNSTTTVSGTITNNGSIGLGANTLPGTLTVGAGSATLAGTGALKLATAGAAVPAIVGTGTLVNGASHTISGLGTFGNNTLAIVNNGTIAATVAGQSLILDPSPAGNLANAGTLSSSATLQLSGNGGGVFNNTGTIVAQNGSNVRLVNNPTINGGTLACIGSGSVELFAGAGTLNGVSNTATFASTSASNILNLAGTILNSGTIFNSGDAMTIGDCTLSGSGTFFMSHTFSSPASARLTSSNLIVGSGTLLNNVLLMTNSGTVSAIGAPMTVDPGDKPGNDFINTGTLESASTGTLILTGNLGGNYLNNGTITSAGTIFLVQGADITGGTFTTTGTGIIIAGNASSISLTSITNTGNLKIEALSSATLNTAVTNNGSINVLGAAVAQARLNVGGSASLTFSGAGTVLLNNATLAVVGGSGTLVNNGNTFVGTGLLGNNEISIRNSATISANSGTQPLSVNPSIGIWTNSGTMNATNGAVLELIGTGGGSQLGNSGGMIVAENNSKVRLNALTINGGTLASVGNGTFETIAGAPSTLQNLTNTGHIVVGNTHQLFIAGAVTNSGTIDVFGGSLELDVTNFNNTAAGIMSLSSAAINGTGTMNNVGGIFGNFTFNGTPPLTVNNSGSINSSGGVISIAQGGPTTIVNTGLLVANFGTGYFLASGTLTGASGSIDIQNGGTFQVLTPARVSVGDIRVTGTLVNAGSLTAGLINGAGTLQNGMTNQNVSMTFTSARVMTAVAASGVMKTIAGGGTVGTSRIGTAVLNGTLTIDTSDSKWDLTDHDLIVDYSVGSPLGTIFSYISTAYHNGAWDGFGLTSSSAQNSAAGRGRTALAYAEAGVLNITSFSGQTVDLTTALVKYTYSGDANIDGVVNALDFNAVAINFGGVGTKVWIQGDFNYDGTTNTADFTLLAMNFNQVLASPGLGSIVPEPGLAFIAAYLTLIRRRRFAP